MTRKSASSQSERDRRVDDAMIELEQWLSTHAASGVPELALAALLRTYAEGIEDLGYVPQTWPEPARVSSDGSRTMR